MGPGSVIADRLRVFLTIQARRPFAWGRCDCVLFASDWVADLTGCDPAAGYRHTYGNARAAAGIVRTLGGWHALGDRSGWRKRLPGDPCHLGDVVLLRANCGPAEWRYGLAGSDGWIVKPMGGGWARVPVTHLTREAAWECSDA